jgi:hypothetical protein
MVLLIKTPIKGEKTWSEENLEKIFTIHINIKEHISMIHEEL